MGYLGVGVRNRDSPSCRGLREMVGDHLVSSQLGSRKRIERKSETTLCRSSLIGSFLRTLLPKDEKTQEPPDCHRKKMGYELSIKPDHIFCSKF